MLLLCRLIYTASPSIQRSERIQCGSDTSPFFRQQVVRRAGVALWSPGGISAVFEVGHPTTSHRVQHVNLYPERVQMLLERGWRKQTALARSNEENFCNGDDMLATPPLLM